MITVSKDAIKYRDSNGQMQNADIMCQVGALSDGDNYLKHLNIARFNNLNKFAKSEIVLEFEELTTTYMMFSQSVLNTTVESISIKSLKQLETCGSMFLASSSGDTTLKRITLHLDFSQCASYTSVFRYLNSLEIIDGTPIDVSSCTNFGLFVDRCFALKEIRFVPLSIHTNLPINHSSVLSDESIQSIIDGLADLTGAASQTLTLHAGIKAKLTEEQLTTITNKNWVLA